MNPPPLARLLARITAPREDRSFVLADLDARFADLAGSAGRSRAGRWYWSQVLRGLLWRARPSADLLPRRSWEGTVGDVRVGARALLRRPMYTLGVVGTLALGLGSAALVFAVAWRVWLAPMPFPTPDRVVRLFETEPAAPSLTSAGESAPTEGRWRISPPLLQDMRRHDWQTIEAVAGISEDELDWATAGETRRISSVVLSPEAFDILGIVPLAGRVLAEQEEDEVLLTERFWNATLGGNPEVVGTSLTLDGVSHRIAGIVRLPQGYPRDTDVVTRFAFAESDLVEGMRGARYLDVIARVRPERSIEEAKREAGAFVATLGESHPQHRGWGADAVELGADLLRPFRGVLALLLAAGATFLALAVVNVGGLVAARRAEVGGDRVVRLALGASEGRLLRGSMVESAILGTAGAGVALLLARWLLPPLRALVPQDVPRLAGVSIDTAFATGVLAGGVTLGAAVGLLGYLMARGTGVGAPPMKGRTSSAHGLRGREYLVVSQIALTTLLTTGGIAILRHASELRGLDVGFTAEGVLNSSVVLSDVRFPTEEARLDVWRRIDEGLAARGIVAAVGVNAPMSGSNMPFGFRVDAASEQAFAQYHSVTDSYFDVLGIDVVDGRVFGPDDRAGSAPVLVISEAFEREHYPGGAVGKEIDVLAVPRTIVGVVRSTRHFGPDADVQLEMYVPLGQDPWQLGTVLMRTGRADAAQVLASVAREVDPALRFPPPEPYTAHLNEWYAPLRLQLVMVGGLALLGLALASLGLYALVAYHVLARRREIGIRIALGAPVDRVFRTVVGSGLRLALFGGTAGLAAWYALFPLLAGLIDGMDRADIALPVLVAAVVGSACLLATVAPAWRSTAVDPAATLKAE